MKKASRVLRLASALAALLLAAALIWLCADIYLSGSAPENMENGVYLSPIYSRENVAARLSALAPWGLGCLALLAVSLFVNALAPGDKAKGSRPAPPEAQKRAKPLVPALLLAAALVFILLGVMNGGARDVLIKAVNICTECIGLG